MEKTDNAAKILSEQERKRKLREEYVRLSEEIIEIKENLEKTNTSLTESNKELDELIKAHSELLIEVSMAENVKDKLSEALNESAQRRRDHEKALNELYGKIEEGTNRCMKKYSSLVPELADFNELNLSQEGEIGEEVRQNITRKAKIDTLLFFNNIQVKVLNQLQEFEEEGKLLALLETDF